MKIKIKKALCVLFAIILVCAGLSACGKSQCYAKITYSDGSSEMLDTKKLRDLRRENEYAYNEKYRGNKIEAVDRIISISSGAAISGAAIETSDWFFYLDKYDPILVDLREGTLVKIYGKITDASNSSRPQIYVDTIVIIEEK